MEKKDAQPSQPWPAIAYDGVWDQEDERARNECLARMLDPKPPLLGDPSDFPAGGDFLCLPREVLQERTYNLFQTASVLYGLIFSGVAGSALSPFDVSEYAEGSNNRTLANVYNLCATVQFVVCADCMWEATVMALAVCSESDLTIYRFAVHTSRIAWSLMVNTGYSTMLLIAQVLVVTFMKTDPVVAYVILIIVMMIFLAKMAVFWPRFMHASPGYVYPMVNGLVGPVLRLGLFGPGKQAAKEKADRLAALKAEEAASNFGAHVLDAVRESLSGSGEERNKEETVGGAPHAATEEMDELGSEQGRLLSGFLEAALPEAPPERLKTLCVALIRADLYLHTMKLAAQNPLLLDQALGDDGMRLNMRPGERLALLSSLGSGGEMGAAFPPARSPTSAATGRKQDPCISISGGAFGTLESSLDSTHATSPHGNQDRAGAVGRYGLSLSLRVGALEMRVLGAVVEACPLAHRISALEALCGVQTDRHKDIQARLVALEDLV